MGCNWFLVGSRGFILPSILGLMESIGGEPWVSDWDPLVLKRVPRFHVWGLWVLGGIPSVPSDIEWMF